MSVPYMAYRARRAIEGWYRAYESLFLGIDERSQGIHLAPYARSVPRLATALHIVPADHHTLGSVTLLSPATRWPVMAQPRERERERERDRERERERKRLSKHSTPESRAQYRTVHTPSA
eukprot:2390193-Rhodomonas_salina.1